MALALGQQQTAWALAGGARVGGVGIGAAADGMGAGANLNTVCAGADSKLPNPPLYLYPAPPTPRLHLSPFISYSVWYLPAACVTLMVAAPHKRHRANF